MSDSEDGDRADGPSDVPPEEDPFEYPSDTDDTSSGGEPTDRPSGPLEWASWFWNTDRGSVVYVRDVVTSVAAVLLVGLLLFAISGIWPPMVAVESGSMEPNMNVGDLVFVVDNERFTPDDSVVHEGQTTGVVPADRATETGHTEFGRPGDVIVFMPNGDGGRTPVIHRAMLWVEEGENWYDRADQSAIGSADSCQRLNHCPAPHAGFITLGDANSRYDQQTTLSAPVRPQWIIGTAEVKVPYLGYVRLAFSGQVSIPLNDVPVTERKALEAMNDAPPAERTATVPSTGTAHPVA